MVIRADDIGYTDVCNIGTFQTMESHGVVSSADVMLDTPGTVDALRRLKELPWISTGWHAHFWGEPLLNPKEVPSLVVNDSGRIRFRKDLQKADDVVYEQLLRECRAQLDRVHKILGRNLDTGPGAFDSSTPYGRAMTTACEDYGIVIDFATRQSIADDGTMKFKPAEEKWATRKICQLDPGPAYRDLLTDSVTQLEQYDPYKYYAEDRAHLTEFPPDAIVEQSWHPGWVDYYVYRLGDYGPRARNFIVGRTVDVEAMCSDRMRNWIRENHIELVNYRDALYGSSEYQNHLKAIGSDLCVI
jgi:predicted glycoside hydrolase/deacetylase ChbG (UPF0249 family)